MSVGFVLLSLLLQVNLNPDFILNTAQACSNCHTGALSLDPEDAFSVEDLDTNSAVEIYEAGKEYRIRIQYNPILAGGNYRVAYRVGAFDRLTGSLKKGSFADPEIGNFEFNASENQVANIITTPNLEDASNVYINWTAPEDGQDVIFFFVRVEANGDNAQSGDRGSNTLESFVLEGPNDDSSGGGDTDGSDSNSGGSAAGGSGNSESAFSEGFTAGCSLQEDSDFQFIGLWLLSVFGLLYLYRRSQSEKIS